MSYESTAEPIRLGYLIDFTLPDGYPQEGRDDLVLPFELVFGQGHAQGMIDRPVEIVFREVEGLPKGTSKAVIDAFEELVDQGCLAVFGPHITDNCVPTREAIEERFRVPAISVTGTDDWLGEWTFSLPQGSMTDEPIFWADLLAKDGHTEIGALIEQSLVGDTYIRNFRKACAAWGLRIVAEEWIPQTGQDIEKAVRKLYDAKPEAIVHCGFGFGIVLLSPVLDAARLESAAVHGHGISERVDPRGDVAGDRGLDRVRPVRRSEPGRPTISRSLRIELRPAPEYCVPVVNHDVATVAAPRVRRRPSVDAARGQGGPRTGEDDPSRWQERQVPVCPSGSGPGAGWMGAGYLVARQLDPEFGRSHLVGRFGEV